MEINYSYAPRPRGFRKLFGHSRCASSMIERMALRWPLVPQPDRARDVDRASSMAAGLGTLGIMPWCVRPVSTSATTRSAPEHLVALLRAASGGRSCPPTGIVTIPERPCTTMSDTAAP